MAALEDSEIADLYGALGQSTEQFRLAMEAGQIGSFVLDLTTGAITCSAQCKANVGLTADAPYSYELFFNMIYPEDRARVQRAVDTAVHDRVDYKANYRIITPSSGTRWIESTGRPIYGADNTPLQIIGVTQNVTERERNLERLRVSEAAVIERELRIRSLYELTSRTDIGFADKVERLIKTARVWLHMETGLLARTEFTEGTFTVEQIDSSVSAFPPGFSCPLDTTFCYEIVKRGPESAPLAIEHAGTIEEWRGHPAYKTFGSEAYLAAVVPVAGKVWGTLVFLSSKPRSQSFTAFESDVMRLMAQWIGGEIARQEAEALLASNVARQRRFVREMLMSVTDGKLCLCDDAHDLPDPLTTVSEVIELNPTALSSLRKRVGCIAQDLHLPEERCHDLVTAVSEAGMNAIEHGGGGEVQVHFDKNKGMVQVWVADHGTGIREEDLHRATLEKGWSGAGTLGHGFFLILHTVDRTYLLTGQQGTTVVLEQQARAPQPHWLQGIAMDG